MSPCHFDQRAT